MSRAGRGIALDPFRESKPVTTVASEQRLASKTARSTVISEHTNPAGWPRGIALLRLQKRHVSVRVEIFVVEALPSGENQGVHSTPKGSPTSLIYPYMGKLTSFVMKQFFRFGKEHQTLMRSRLRRFCFVRRRIEPTRCRRYTAIHAPFAMRRLPTQNFDARGDILQCQTVGTTVPHLLRMTSRGRVKSIHFLSRFLFSLQTSLLRKRK